MIFFVKKINKLFVYAGLVFFSISFFLGVHIFENRWDNGIDEDGFMEELDLIEESEAEEDEQDELDAINEEKFSEINEGSEGENKIKEEEIEQSQTYSQVKSVEKEVVSRKPPRSIVKYGLTFYPPDQYKLDKRGRMVCIHESDKPSVSNQDKPIHMDMQCCLDPDEIPNPFCYYPRDKYGKLLDDFNRKKEKMLRRYKEGKGL